METAKKKRKKWPWILLCIVIVMIAAVVMLINSVKKSIETVAYSEYTVARGEVVSTITGSGKLEAAGSMTIKLPSGVEVDEVLVEAGDAVSEGDVLAVFDSDSLVYRAAELSDELAKLDQQVATRSALKRINVPVKGRVKYLPAAVGDKVLDVISRYGVLAIISTDDLMQVEIDTEAELALNSAVTVKWADGSVDGVIASVSADGYIVTLSDEEAPYMESAQVYDGETLLGEGTLAIHAPVGVYATGGTIKEIHCTVNGKVSAWTKMFTLEDKVNTNSYTQKLSDRNDKAAELQAVLNYLTDPRIVATQDGIVSKVYLSVGESVGAASGTDSLAAAFDLSTGGAVKMSIEVDELDINTVKLDQAVRVTIDAFAGETFDATVTHISKIGTASGSITTYAVEVTLTADDRLLEGMNGSAVITANHVENVLLVPIAAISEDENGAYVYIMAADGTQRRADITTGLSDGMNAEVTSGLSEGDVVVYLDSVTDSLALMMNNYNRQGVASTDGGE